MSQYEHFGPPEAPGPFGGFSGPPNQGPTEGSREPRRRAGPAERRRRARSVQGRRRVKRPEVARGLAASNAGRDSGSSSRPARRRTTKLFFKTSPAREPFRNPILQTHDRQEVHLRILKIQLGSRTRPPSADLGREISKSLSAPQPQREREFLIRPLDT